MVRFLAASAAVAAVSATAAVPGVDSPAGCPSGTVFALSNGSDTNDGCSAATAVQSLSVAQEISRATAASHPSTQVFVSSSRVRGEGITFGSNDTAISWTGISLDGESPATISGSILLPPLSTWQNVTDPDTLARIRDTTARSVVRKLPLDGLATADEVGRLTRHGYAVGAAPPPMELFYNGEKLQRSRWPKPGDPLVAMSTVQNGNSSAPMFSLNTTRPFEWPASALDDDGIWLEGIVSENWAWTYNHAIPLANGSMTLQYPEQYEVQIFAYNYCCHNRFFFDNVFEEISQPGEYYINTTEQAIYIIPPTDSTNERDMEAGDSQLTASVLSTPVFSFQPDAVGVKLANVSITETRGTAIDANEAIAIELRNLEIHNIGLAGATVGRASNLVDSHIYNVGTEAVSVSGGNVTSLQSGDSRIANVHIHDFAQWNKVYEAGVSISGVGNTGANQHCQHVVDAHAT
mgnify:FL=1